jgi:hypothetical protein
MIKLVLFQVCKDGLTFTKQKSQHINRIKDNHMAISIYANKSIDKI